MNTYTLLLAGVAEDRDLMQADGYQVDPPSSVDELRDMLLEAGFSDVTVYWEGEDEDGEGNGEFTPSASGEADLAWIAYIVAEK